MKTESIPLGWQLTTLGDIAKKEYGLVDGPFGSNLPASEYVLLGVPVIRGSNLSLGGVSFKGDEFVYVSEKTAKRLERSLCVPEDIVFTKKGTLGQTGFVPTTHRYKKFLISSNQMKLSVDRKVADPRFVYYYVSSPTSREKIIRDSEVTGVPKTNLAYLRTFPIVLPPLAEQKAIAHILGTLDDKIELNQQMNQTLEAIARALFKSWFIDFDPVRAKLDGRQPIGMDAETAALFPAEFEDSALGKIPKGWSVSTLEQVVSVNSLSITKSYPHQVIQYVDISSVTVGRLEETTIYVLSDAPSRAKRLVRHGDTIWSGVRPNRKSYLFIHTPPENLVVSTGFIVLSPQAIPPSYLYAWVTTDEFVDYLVFNADGSAYPAVRPDRFSDAQILIPLKAILDKFEQQVESMRDKIIQNERESRVLASIRDALLPKLLSGEIRVQDAETVVEAVT